MREDKEPRELTPAERALLSRTRHAMTRLVGLDKGDELTDQLYDHLTRRDDTPCA